jgi:hypothetical protein
MERERRPPSGSRFRRLSPSLLLTPRRKPAQDRVMRRLLAVLLAFIALSCSRYETRTADGVTLRIDKTTGKTDKLIGNRWVPIGEPIAMTKPAAYTEDRRGKPCGSDPSRWADEIDEVIKTGCTPNQSRRTSGQ